MVMRDPIEETNYLRNCLVRQTIAPAISSLKQEEQRNLFLNLQTQLVSA